MNPSETAVQRLARSRAQAGQWLDQDLTRRNAFADSSLGQFAGLPWIRRLGGHPLASLALGAVTRWWMKPRQAHSPVTSVLALNTSLGLLRRRPLLTLATLVVISTVVWWTQFRKHTATSQIAHLK
ncbi:hypothetical protein [Hydrogenophaga sp. PBL-H3]|uniref:hypothetical protein n=1 Tax=Hydrogenophaga sp. PBL-H3 TaxID=434010 RepID=UPI00131FA720|nr:hypothetical protein [Hydrogenophaga sp. PBL-H3]QHE76302.1 hypothetical protein F9Z45_09655 [Hydrogenophaga sp. PBL-H3]QHE80726.1 hypothetical protein F9Z44_09655 [Hydrogenophaga sp. PBL-H3]